MDGFIVDVGTKIAITGDGTKNCSATPGGILWEMNSLLTDSDVSYGNLWGREGEVQPY